MVGLRSLRRAWWEKEATSWTDLILATTSRWGGSCGHLHGDRERPGHYPCQYWFPRFVFLCSGETMEGGGCDGCDGVALGDVPSRRPVKRQHLRQFASSEYIKPASIVC